MIFALKKVSRIFSTTLSTNFYFSTATPTKQTDSKNQDQYLKFLQDTAKLAADTIHLIASNSDESIKNFSLRDEIIQKINKNKQVSPQAKLQIRRIFDEGIHTQYKIFNQLKIKQAAKYPTSIQVRQAQARFLKKYVEQPARELTIEEILFLKSYFNSLIKTQKQTIIFCPTRLVTSQIFANIMYPHKSNSIMYGSSGISKSLSFVLYQKLSDYIINYKFKVNNTTIKPVPKLLYWSLDVERDTIQAIKSRIQKQCPQMLTEQKQASQDIENYQEIYQSKGIPLKLIIDQYESLSILNRQCKKESMQSKQKHKKQLSSIKQVISQSQVYFKKIMFINSSDRIQKQILEFTQCPNNPTQMCQIKYLELLTQKKPMHEIADYIFFEYERQLKINNFVRKINDEVVTQEEQRFIDDKMKYILRQYLANHMYTHNQKHLSITQSGIRDYIKKLFAKKLTQIRKLRTMPQFQQHITRQIDNIAEYCLIKPKQKILNFLKKNRSQKDLSEVKTIIATLFLIRSFCCINNGKGNARPSFNLNNSLLDAKQIQQCIYNHDFFYSTQKSGQISLECEYPSRVYISIIDRQSPKLIDRFINIPNIQQLIQTFSAQQYQILQNVLRKAISTTKKISLDAFDKIDFQNLSPGKDTRSLEIYKKVRDQKQKNQSNQ